MTLTTVLAPPDVRGADVRYCDVRYCTGEDGLPVGSHDRAGWLAARRTGVTATDCTKIVRGDGTPSVQRAGLLEKKVFGAPDREFWGYAHGREREPVIAAWVREEYGIEPNALLCAGADARHLATPDGIGAGVVAEIKTSVLPLRRAMGRYRDQVQWQLHVTGAERSLFVVENRYTLEREVTWVERDEVRLAVLVDHADAFLDELAALRTEVAERRRRMAERRRRDR
ncbi:YqaJ viral recombinase family protein [Cellulomonas sp. PhB143]|uniref:YqaJ viral recombinase family protein n=1 Tax=Cellulomonas sp. PhB143 TaxID=2485186 RepID=UPI001315A1CF|nr:YqaJ viral recombinase family protein [Cellulomonas sp. PhB143]